MCDDQLACTQDPDATHFDNYLAAARAYEESASGSATLSTTDTFESLLVPQPQDLEIELRSAKSDFYRGSGFYVDATGDLYRDLWFAAQVENVAEVPADTLAMLTALRAQRWDEIESAVAPYRSDAVQERYNQLVDAPLRNSTQLTEIIETMAAREARATSFARALERGVPVPAAASAAFERIWNADAFTPGSRLFMERELRSAVHERAELLASPHRQAFAEQRGFADAALMMRACNVTMLTFRRQYPARGRNNRETVAAVFEAMERDL